MHLAYTRRSRSFCLKGKQAVWCIPDSHSPIHVVTCNGVSWYTNHHKARKDMQRRRQEPTAIPGSPGVKQHSQPSLELLACRTCLPEQGVTGCVYGCKAREDI
ncbi:hypothetical protein WJX82_005393 [Trebouxia sp. C0006]